MTKPAAPAKRNAKRPIGLKITLRNVRPPIWRRIVVTTDMTLGELHLAIGCPAA